MICQLFEQLAPQIARNELRDAKLLQDAMNHAASCASCAAILVEEREIAASVAALGAHDKAIDSARHLEFTLRAAFVRETAANSVLNSVGGCEFERAGHGPAPTTASNVFVGANFRRAALWLAAAAAIIFTLLLLPRILNRNPELNRIALAPNQTTAPSVTPAIITPPVQTAAPAEQKHLAASHKPKKISSVAEKTLTGFLALPYADDLSTIEYGAIVRLQMSRADLAWYGLPVPISDNGQKITADLFVNGSGTPEAIRLVR